MLSRYHVAALAFVVCITMAQPVRAQVNAGWKASANAGARYGAQDTASKGPFAGPGGNQQAPAAAGTKPAASSDVTPVGGALAPLNPGITRARVSKGDGALPQDKGQVWREYD